MPKGRDRFREYVDYLENNKWKCKFCGIESQGSATRIRAHLAGILRYGITACEKVDHQVRVEALETFNGKGSGLDKSMGGTSGEGMERAVFGTSQSVLPSDGALNPNDIDASLGEAFSNNRIGRVTRAQETGRTEISALRKLRRTVVSLSIQIRST
ncbi:hypothetical protein ACJRO7_009612 [Eucalyptus globulus]|uniref:BED-type domain-containing protein n=1 Tax=Eucalyptus globulus TaxID=34317 RepID=A0ABD3LA38_EUCGL